jgi:hypothetical protein
MSFYRIKPNTHKYRDEIPSMEADIVIISLVHQSLDLLNYMIENVDKFVKGRKLMVFHLNLNESVDETKLPPWVWLTRTTIHTKVYDRTLMNALTECLRFATQHFRFQNILTMSSSTVFIKPFTPPLEPTVCIRETETLINPEISKLHTDAFHISKMGRIREFLKLNKSFEWQYHGCDFDTEFHELMKKRHFQFFHGSDWSGIIFPQKVAHMLAEDLPYVFDKENGNYSPEEIYMATYAFNYAIENKMKVERSICLINWNHYYDIHDPTYIETVINRNYPGIYMVCKLMPDVYNMARMYVRYLPAE